MTRNQFDLLMQIRKSGYRSQRDLSARMNASVGKINGIIKELQNEEYIEHTEDRIEITEKGYEALKPYKVDNAIIMAAGMSSRFAPLSYEKPKGMLNVKGEVLIERQIRQLKEAGIDDITVVVGYMKEQFFYLEEKYGAAVVVNEDYYRYNNTSTLIRVLDKLKNTYICSSDNYFTENVFEEYVYEAYYSAVMIEGKCDEYGIVCNNKGQIIRINHNPEDMWCMMGHVFFSRNFSEKFKEILRREYEKGPTRFELWESLLERYLNELEIYIRKYERGVILEFDSLKELRDFDDKYINNSGSKIFRNICEKLNCRESDIQSIRIIKQGMTNLSFRFCCKGKEYVYRHPGAGTEKYISRKSEAFSTEIAGKLGLDTTVVAMDEEEGWKLSKYIHNVRTLDYDNKREVSEAIDMMRTLHNARIHSDYDFGIWRKTENLIEKINASQKDFEDFTILQSTMKELYELTENDRVEKILCHCDCYSPNFLIGEDGKMTLIDWEYSGNDDPANDLGTFICCSHYNYDEAIDVIRQYYQREPSNEELRHAVAYIAISSYYWYIWAIYQESRGNTIGEYLLLWYKNSKLFHRKAMEMYREA